jgi:hypothetical protein
MVEADISICILNIYLDLLGGRAPDAGKAASVDHGFNPETKHPDVQANATSWSPANRPDSAQVIPPKMPDLKKRNDKKIAKGFKVIQKARPIGKT